MNLTDGLDGLATGCTATVAAAYAVLAYISGNTRAADYLQIPYVPFSAELAVVCSALLGSCLGFLWWNAIPPASSWATPARWPSAECSAPWPSAANRRLLLVIVGGVFVMEALVGHSAGRKLQNDRQTHLQMSPIHHHFELNGWKENTVIVRFWILSVMFALLGLATLKLR